MRKLILIGSVLAALVSSSSDAEACFGRRRHARVACQPVTYVCQPVVYYYYPQIDQPGDGQGGVASLQNLPAPDVSEIHAADNLPKPKGVDEIMSDLTNRAQQVEGANP